jgi:hypothetical protein
MKYVNQKYDWPHRETENHHSQEAQRSIQMGKYEIAGLEMER